MAADALLDDIGWLTCLATTLAHDRDDADDLVQEAWIAAWRKQPDTAARPIRAWLTKVVRDVAGMKRRSDRRRAAREARVAEEDARAPATPDELVAQVRLQQCLAELVLELDEPYRSTIIARFVEGRTAASIAAGLGIPAGTVRKRLHEALARLRAGLDAGAGGDRKGWAPAVLAFAKGGMFVAKPTKLVLVVVVVAALVLLLGGLAAVIVGGRAPAHEAVPPTTAAAPMTPAASGAPAAGSALDAPSRPPQVSAQHAAERATMLAAITRARDHRRAALAPPPPRPGGSTAASGDVAGAPATTLDITDRTGDTSAWSKRALGTLNQVMGQCYDLGRAEDPDLAGTVTVQFTLVGEPGVGGLLESVEIVDASTTITQETIRDCFTQQLYALELDPPPDGVTVQRMLSLKVP